MTEHDRLHQTFIEAGVALLERTRAGTVCEPIGAGLWVAVGDPESIRRMLPPSAVGGIGDELRQGPAGSA